MWRNILHRYQNWKPFTSSCDGPMEIGEIRHYPIPTTSPRRQERGKRIQNGSEKKAKRR